MSHTTKVPIQTLDKTKVSIDTRNLGKDWDGILTLQIIKDDLVIEFESIPVS